MFLQNSFEQFLANKTLCQNLTASKTIKCFTVLCIECTYYKVYRLVRFVVLLGHINFKNISRGWSGIYTLFIAFLFKMT